MRRFFAAALLLCVVGCASNPHPTIVPALKHDALSISATPQQSFEPAWMHFRIHVDRAPENRMLAWMCDSGDGMRFSSETQLNGDHAPQTFDVERPDVTGGEYACVAAVSRQGLPPLYAHTTFRVIPRN